MKKLLACFTATLGLAAFIPTYAAPGGADFTIAIIPDTQYYTSNGGNMSMFTAQTDWIVNNRVTENIAYVIHLGDSTDHGDSVSSEWVNAANAMYRLETPVSIPYGIAVGNHDQSPNTGFPLTCTTTYYNQYFGVSRFSGRTYYGGHYSTNNDSHFDLFTAGGMDFIVIYVEYDSQQQDWTNMNNWVDGRLAAYPSRKAIIVTHYLVDNGNPAPFSPQAQAIYNRIKARPNVVLMFGGHIAGNGEGQRRDVYNGKTTQSFLSDYQGRANGGNGLMRLIKISPVNDTISVKTYSPYLGTYETDADSQFTRPFLQHLPKRVCYFETGGKTDRSLFNSGVWKVEGQSDVTNGQAGDIPVPGDYDGDGKTDYAVWRPATGEWIIPGMTTVVYGQSGDIPVPADYDGDGKTDRSVYRPSVGTWFVYGIGSTVYGNSTDIPVPGDYDGDGKSDYAVWRPATGVWYTYGQTAVTYGQSGDIPVPGDYNGDGITDRAVWRPSNGTWYRNGTSTVYGQNGDIPVPGDYNGDGVNDLAVYRPSTFTWYTLGTTVTLGASGEKPLPLPYCIRKFFFP
ncbi:MAG: hypothetical protein HZA31_07435 [Opitutae bacterium]|nr:hypothetical protein [Opitutae bacterium]